MPPVQPQPNCQSEHDACHPRFIDPEDPEVVFEYQTKHDYYCPACNMFFAPTYTGVKMHFRDDFIVHRPYGLCMYCKGPAYEYRLNNRIKLFHNCSGKETCSR